MFRKLPLFTSSLSSRRVSASRRRRAQGERDRHIEPLESRSLLAVVAVYDDAAFVDTAGGVGAESDNLQASLAGLGHTVHTFTGTSAASFIAGLKDAQVLVIPELENGNLSGALNSAAKGVIKSFVDGGGGLIISGEELANRDIPLLNTVFGFGLSRGVAPFAPSAKNGATAAGTPFAAGPAALADNNATVTLTKASLPAGAKSLYETGGDTTVALFKQGLGNIVYLGWDWFDAKPVGGQDGGWLGTLGSAVTATAQSLNVTADLSAVANDGHLDEMTLQRVANNPLLVRLTEGPLTLNVWTYAALNSITVNGSSDAETLNVLFKDAGPAVPAGGLTFDGNLPFFPDGADQLRISGLIAETEAVYIPDTVVNSTGKIEVTDAVQFPGLTLPISFKGTESPIVFANAKAVTIRLPNDGDAVDVSQLETDRALISGQMGGVGFEEVDVAHVNSLTIDTFDQQANVADHIVVHTPLVAGDLQNFAIRTQGGDDTIELIDGHLALPVAGGVFSIDAGQGIDKLIVNGDDNYTLTNAALTSSSAAVALGGTVENAIITGGPSANALNAATFDLGSVTLRGGAGDDTLTGGTQIDRLEGEDGNDVLTGGKGNDQLFGGHDSDTLIWNNGDNSDLMEGGDGLDRVVVNGSTLAGDNFQVRASGARVQFDRVNLIPFTLDIGQTEQLDFNTGPGADSVLVGDLSGTETKVVNIDFGADADADAVTILGTTHADVVQAGQVPGGVRVSGLAYNVNLANVSSATEKLTIDGGDSDDDIRATPGLEAAIQVALLGGSGNDYLAADATLVGGAGDDTLIGGAGDDSLDGGDGNDVFLGSGGNDTINPSAGVDTIWVPGTAGNDTISVALNGADLDVTVNGALTKYLGIAGSSVERVLIEGYDGDDTINVEPLAGINIVVDAGGPTASDTLNVVVPQDVRVTQGAESTTGTVDQTGGGDIDFRGVESMSITSAGGSAVLTQRGTDDNDSIALQFLGGRNRTWINDGTVVAFTNFPFVALQGRFGDDKFSVNTTGLQGVQNIDLAGGDPDASDLLVVSGNAGLNTFDFTSLSLNSGQITVDGGPVIDFSTVEAVELNGLGGGDLITFEGTAGDDEVEFTAGKTRDSGGLQLNSFVPINFQKLGADGGVVLIDNGGNDRLTYVGTGGSDRFAIINGEVDLTNSAGTHVFVVAAGFQRAIVDGRAGDDTFLVTDTQAFTGGLTIEGGDPSASDILNFVGTGIGNVTVDIAAQTITEAGQGPVSYVGVEQINLDPSGAEITVVGGAADENLIVTPNGTDRGTFAEREGGPQFAFTNTSSFSVDLGAGNDNLQVVGAAAAETINVSETAVAIAGKIAVNLTGVEALAVDGRQGADTFNVTPGAIPIFIDGGDPIGVLPGDTLKIIPNGNPITYFGGPENDEGGIDVGPNATVSFDHIESLGPFDMNNDPCPAVIVGTNGNDHITVIARDASFNAAADGVRDFTVSINNGPNVLFLNVVELDIDAAAGNDEVVVQTPAPNDAEWNMIVNVVGGTPSAVGDTFVLETPFQDTVTYQPLTSETGQFVIDEPVNDTFINMVASFHVVCPGLDYTSSTGGFEHIVYDGESAADSLTILGTGGDDEIVHKPGAGADEGTVRVNSLLALDYQNLGAGVSVGISGNGGTDELVAYGTNVVDKIGLTGSTLTLNKQLPIAFNGVSTVTIHSLAGDDVITLAASLAPLSNVTVDGGEPSGSDVLVVNGTAGDDAIAVQLDAQDSVINGLGAAIDVIGVETVKLNGNGGTDTVTAFGTVDDDLIVYTPTNVSAGTFSLDGSNTLFQFTGIDGNFTVFGQGGVGADAADIVQVVGTNNHDLITVNSPSGIITVQNAAGIDLKPVVLGDNVEIVQALGRLGNDTFLVIPAPPVSVGANNHPINLLVYVDGGQPGASDALIVAGPDGAPLAPDLLAVVNRGRVANEGVVRIYQDSLGAGNEPTQWPDIVYTGVEVVAPNVANNANGDPLELVLGADNYEPNEFRQISAYLGSGDAINVSNLAIFPNADEHPLPQFTVRDRDFFRVVAKETGILDFQVYFTTVGFEEFLPGKGDLQIQVRDDVGNIITSFGVNDFTANDERRRIPVVAGQTYYLEVFGAQSTTVNAYNLTIVNSKPPVPRDLELADAVTLGGPIDGLQEVPPSGSLATGVVNMNFNPITNRYDLDVFVTGINLADVTNAHLHRGAVGVNGPVIVDLLALGAFVVDGAGIRLKLTQQAFPVADVANLLAGNIYVNVHTTTVPTGEVRGQLPVTGATEISDSGRSQFDNVTCDNTPTIFIRLDDDVLLNDLHGGPGSDLPPDGQKIPIPFLGSGAALTSPGYRVAVFDEKNTQAPVPLGFADQVPGQPGVYKFTFTTPLTDGSHFITAKVQIVDPSTPNDRDFGPASVSLEIVVDTVAPPVFFGAPGVATDGLHPDSDTGVIGQPVLNTDRITSDTTPTFFGQAEANAIVRLFADANNDGVLDEAVDIFLGQTVAVPLDGTNQFPTGQWTLTSQVDLNNPLLFGHDGTRRIFATAEDLAGTCDHTTAFPVQTLLIHIDTAGPQITDVAITGSPLFNLFANKPANAPAGPTPLVHSLTISVRDLPGRDTVNFPNDPAVVAAVAVDPGKFVLRGDANGVIPISSVIVIDNPLVNGAFATATIQLTFFAPLPDDRYTLTINDGIKDTAGNALDGESNAVEPVGTPSFPSGDGQPGGAFVARFTVDSRPEIGVYSSGTAALDLNGNLHFDEQNLDFTNRDIVVKLGFDSDRMFAGNFAGAGGVADGFDKLATYGFVSGAWRFLIDTNNDAVPDVTTTSTIAVDGLAFAADFAPLTPGDEVGVFDGKTWYLDTNGSLAIDAGDTIIAGGDMRGYPIVGDFDGDGNLDLGTWALNRFYFDLAADGLDGNADATIDFGFSGVVERPVADDMDQDGITDIGLWVPGRSQSLPTTAGEWYFLMSTGGGPSPGAVTALNHAFSPIPLGNDINTQFGDEFALPIVGNFDPPLVGQPPAKLSWVAKLYTDVLGRTPSTGETAFWENAVSKGATYQQVAEAFMTSDERRGNIIDQLYQDYLGRHADAGGLKYWIGVWNAHKGPEHVQAGIIGSEEYYRHAGGTDSAWVTALYRNILKRDLDQAGHDFWVEYIQSNSKQSVVLGFVTSDEYRLALIASWYQSYLGRTIDDSGAQFWLQQMKNGLKQETIQNGLLASKEYRDRLV